LSISTSNEGKNPWKRRALITLAFYGTWREEEGKGETSTKRPGRKVIVRRVLIY